MHLAAADARKGAPRLAMLGLVAALALATSGCLTRGPATTGSIDPTRVATMSERDLRASADMLARRNAANPTEPRTAIAYAAVLRRLDQRAQAVAVLQQAAVRNPGDRALMGAYGRALADSGRLREAQEVLARAHSPQQPDWRILSAQGTVADQLGEQARAQELYQAALNLAPGEPSVLSNFGLSLALSRKLPEAEAKLRTAAADPRADQRVRQNLALVLGLQGKFDEAEGVLARDLSPNEVADSIAAIRSMITQDNSWARLRASDASRPRR